MSYRKLIEIGLDGKLVSVTIDQSVNIEVIEQVMIDGMRILIGQNAIKKQQKDKVGTILSPHNGKPILKP